VGRSQELTREIRGPEKYHLSRTFAPNRRESDRVQRTKEEIFL
jgi:hypothetical protein